MKKTKKTVTKEDLLQQIEDEFQRWDHIHLLPGPWVSVEVQPTPGGKDVLLAIGQTDVFMGYRVGGQYYDSECCGTYGVTHWMDKPDAPEVEK